MNRNNGFHPGFVHLFIVLPLLLFMSVPRAEVMAQLDDPQMLKDLLDRAERLKLAHHPAWLNLLHYRRSLLGGMKSQADDPAFFLADTGGRDAGAELVADLRAFFTDSRQAQCRFPARLHWLDSQLHFGPQMPRLKCGEFTQWRQRFDVQGLTLLFPAMHLDNPASMFGHSFLRLDGGAKNSLLDTTLSYAAAYDETDFFMLYAWKGMTGGYAGQFYMRPYFETLQTYHDIEQRDIWEYRLNLDAREIDQLMRHLWEIKGIKFEYYFLQENCAYRLLGLLDVATNISGKNSNMSLNSHPLYAIPVDTVRDIEAAGLIAARYYRPSRNNKIRQMSGQLDQSARQRASMIAENQYPPEELLNKADGLRQARILSLADELVSQRQGRSEQSRELQFRILRARSELPAKNVDELFDFNGVPPEQAHQSARWQFSAGHYENRRFYEMGLRPAFHDLLDAPQGFLPGASIRVLDTRLRWLPEQDELKLESLDLFSMRSLVAFEPWTRPLSRQLSLQLKKRELTEQDRITELEAGFFAGYSAQLRQFMAYMLGGTQLDYSGQLENNHALYLGLDTGVLWYMDTPVLNGQMEISYRNLQQLSGEPGNRQQLKAAMQINLQQNHALRVEYRLMQYEKFDIAEAKLSYLFYF